MPRTRLAHACAAALALATSSCQPPEPPPPPRAYLLTRNAVDPAKPCLIAKLAVVPVKLIYNIVFVPVEVDGTGTVGVLDTGSDSTLLTPGLVAAAKLKPLPNQPRIRMRGLAGGYDVQAVLAATIQVGALRVTQFNPPYVVDFDGSRAEKVGALIGQNLIDGLDWDIDFVHGKMTSFKTRNCHDIDPLWDTKSTGLPLTRGTNSKFSALANGLGLVEGVTIPVEFDGGSLNAIFDTGSVTSYLTREAAHRAGITNTQLDRDPIVEIHAINGRKKKVRRHRVTEFVVGEELVRDFPVDVAEYFNRDDNFDMILGMDWIATHHIWLSFTTDSLYIDSGEKKPSEWRPAPKLPD